MSESLSNPKLLSLIVGINKFKYIKKPLTGSVNDANNFHAYLQKAVRAPYTYVSKLLLDEKATRDCIIHYFQTHLIAQATKDDICVFYFSGHGGREKAKDIFKQTESDGVLEGIVCHDSGKNGNFKLADKELRYLIHQLSEKGCETITIFDCCHSGNITRTKLLPPPPFSTKKQLPTPTPAREWSDFIFGEDISKPTSNDIKDVSKVLPQGRHIQFSACQDVEYAFENGIRQSGFFTNSLIEVLENTSGAISYVELERRIGLNLNSRKVKQTPILYTPHGERQQLFNRFLSGVTESEFSLCNVADDKHDPNWNVWLMDLGAIHGIKPAGANGSLDEQELVLVDIGDEKQAKAYVQEVFINYSKIKFDLQYKSELNRSKQYAGRINKLMRYPIYILADSTIDKTGADEVYTFLKGKQQELEKENIFIVNKLDKYVIPGMVAYHLHANNDQLYISNINEKKPLFKQIKGYSDTSFDQLIRNLEQISQWHFIKNLHNPVTRYKPNPIELSITTDSGDTQTYSKTDNPIQMRFPDSSDENPSLGLSFLFTNHSGQDIYLACLYLDSLFGVEVDFLEPAVVRLTQEGQGKSVWAARGETIEMELPKHIVEGNLKEERVYLQLMICSQPFETDIFYKAQLEAPDHNKKTEDVPRGFKKPKSEGKPLDWCTQLFSFHIENPLYDPLKG